MKITLRCRKSNGRQCWKKIKLLSVSYKWIQIRDLPLLKDKRRQAVLLKFIPVASNAKKKIKLRTLGEKALTT